MTDQPIRLPVQRLLTIEEMKDACERLNNEYTVDAAWRVCQTVAACWYFFVNDSTPAPYTRWNPRMMFPQTFGLIDALDDLREGRTNVDVVDPFGPSEISSRSTIQNLARKASAELAAKGIDYFDAYRFWQAWSKPPLVRKRPRS